MAEGDVTGTVVRCRPRAPLRRSSSLVGTYISILEDNFQTDLGWTVSSVAGMISGPGSATIPGGWADGSPPHDYDGSGRCYVTDNRQGYDVDGGPTQLISPVLDLSATDDPVVRFAEWFYLR